jgi:hypothetical protein
MAGRLGIDDAEDLSSAVARSDAIQELIATATEATFIFVDQNGWPRGVTMTYVPTDDGRFWFTAVNGRRQVDCVRADGRVAIVISSAGTGMRRLMMSVRGRATVHDDRETKDWFLPAFAGRVAAEPDQFVRLLDSENRVVIEVVPVGKPTSHDSKHMPGDGRGGSGPKTAPNTGIPG